MNSAGCGSRRSSSPLPANRAGPDGRQLKERERAPMRTDRNRPSIRLHIRPGKGVIGGVDIGTAITARNSALAADVAVSEFLHAH